MVNIAQQTTAEDELVLQSSLTGTDANVTALQAAVAMLSTNVRGVAAVDMLADNYIMTDTESNSSVIFVSNQGTGKTLSFSTATDATRPTIQHIVTLMATGDFTLANQSGGANVVLGAGSVADVSTNTGLGVLNTSVYTNINARGKSNGVRVVTGTTGMPL